MNISTITRLIDVAGDITRRHSPLILATSAIVGVVGTAILSAKAATKARDADMQERYVQLDDKLDDGSVLREDLDAPLPLKDYLKVTWKIWLPTVISGAMTVTSIVLLHTTHKKRYAALMGLYVLGDKAFQEYKDSVEEVVSKKDKHRIHEKQAEKVVERLKDGPVRDAAGGETLVYDAFSGRVFRSDMETLRAAVNDFNHNLIHHSYGTLNEFYSLLNLEGIGAGEDLGWNADYLLEARYEATFVSGTTEPAICIEFRNKPTVNYYNNH